MNIPGVCVFKKQLGATLVIVVLVLLTISMLLISGMTNTTLVTKILNHHKSSLQQSYSEEKELETKEKQIIQSNTIHDIYQFVPDTLEYNYNLGQNFVEVKKQYLDSMLSLRTQTRHYWDINKVIYTNDNIQDVKIISINSVQRIALLDSINNQVNLRLYSLSGKMVTNNAVDKFYVGDKAGIVALDLWGHNITSHLLLQGNRYHIIYDVIHNTLTPIISKSQQLSLYGIAYRSKNHGIFLYSYVENRGIDYYLVTCSLDFSKNTLSISELYKVKIKIPIAAPQLMQNYLFIPVDDDGPKCLVIDPQSGKFVERIFLNPRAFQYKYNESQLYIQSDLLGKRLLVSLFIPMGSYFAVFTPAKSLGGRVSYHN
jgi:hypothetical protein